MIGLGTWRCDDDTTERVVYRAIQAGCRQIDCAYEYGNEKAVGRAVKRAISDQIVARSDLFITTKLWNSFHRQQAARAQLEESLRNLQLEYLDCFVIHWPLAFRPISNGQEVADVQKVDAVELYPRVDGHIQLDRVGLHQTWAAMEGFVQEGLTRTIGVSNFTVALLSDLLSYCTIKPFCNQVEVHPRFQNMALVRYCQGHQIKVVAYSPFGGSYDYGVNAGVSLFKHPAIEAIALRHDCSPAEVMLAWHRQSYFAPDLYMVIPKSSSEMRVARNMNPKLVELDAGDLEAIQKIDAPDGRQNDAAAVFWETPVFE